MFEILLGILAFLAIAGSFVVTAYASALIKKGKHDPKLELNLACSRMLTRVMFLVSATLLIYPASLHSFWLFLGWVILLTLIMFIGDYLPRLIGNRFPARTMQICEPLSSLYLLVAWPMTLLFSRLALREKDIGRKHEIIEIIQDAELSTADLKPHERKLFESVASFSDKIAREVMVPRADMFCIKSGMTIKEAAKLLDKQGYSRIPVYKQDIDDIIGLLMYKDVLRIYKENDMKKDPAILEAPIDTILKNVLFAPETKTISSLLQDFRKKQQHLAIIVDEYGSTLGLVTIEDILEEIVGEIEDEYDEEEDLFIPQPDGSWIVDPRMSLIDVEEQLGITIPQEGDYDTVAGYIFQQAGIIPSKGFVIKHDDFTLEILRSSDRAVQKVRIKPIKRP